jgi:hypothetical protein
VESRQQGDQCQFAAAMRARLCMGFIMEVRVNNGNAVDDVTMVKETDVHVVQREYHHQQGTDEPFTFIGHEQLLLSLNDKGTILF